MMESSGSFSTALEKLDVLTFARPHHRSLQLTIDDLDQFEYIEGGKLLSVGREEEVMKKTEEVTLLSPEIRNHSPPTKRKKISQKKQVQDLYVISSSAFPGLVKVGRSNRPDRRRLDLSHGQPVCYTIDLVCHGAGVYEPAIHHQLRSVRHTQGFSREWFECSASDVIEALRVVAPDKMEHLEQRHTVENCYFYPENGE